MISFLTGQALSATGLEKANLPVNDAGQNAIGSELVINVSLVKLKKRDPAFDELNFLIVFCQK